MDTYRGLVTTIVILSIAVLLLAIPRLGGVRVATTGNGLTASTAGFYDTVAPATAAQLHFGNNSLNTLTITPYVAPRYYTYTYTTTPQLPDETGYYPTDLGGDYYIGCTSYTGISTVTGQSCAIRNY